MSSDPINDKRTVAVYRQSARAPMKPPVAPRSNGAVPNNKPFVGTPVKPTPKPLTNSPAQAPHPRPQQQQQQQQQQKPTIPPIHSPSAIKRGEEQEEEEDESSSSSEDEEEEDLSPPTTSSSPLVSYEETTLEHLQLPPMELERNIMNIKKDIHERRFFIQLSGKLRDILHAHESNSPLHKFVSWDASQLGNLLNTPIKDADKVLELSRTGALATSSTTASEGQKTIHAASLVDPTTLGNTFVGKLEIIKANSTLPIPLALIADVNKLSGWNTFARPGTSGSGPEDYAMCYINQITPTNPAAPEVVLNKMSVLKSDLYKKLGHLDEAALYEGLVGVNEPSSDHYGRVLVDSPLFRIIYGNKADLRSQVPDWDGKVLRVPGTSLVEVKIPYKVIARVMELVKKRIAPLRSLVASIYDLHDGMSFRVETFARQRDSLSEEQLDQHVNLAVDFKLTYGFPRSEKTRTMIHHHGHVKTGLQILQELNQ